MAPPPKKVAPLRFPPTTASEDDIGPRRHVPGRDQVEIGQDVPGRHRVCSGRRSHSGAHQHNNRRRHAQRMHRFRHFGLLPQNAAVREKAGIGWALMYECCSAASILLSILFWRSIRKDLLMLRCTLCPSAAPKAQTRQVAVVGLRSHPPTARPPWRPSRPAAARPRSRPRPAADAGNHETPGSRRCRRR